MSSRKHIRHPVLVSRWPNTAAVYADANGIIRATNRAAQTLLLGHVRVGVPLAAVLMHIGWSMEPSETATSSPQILHWRTRGGPYLARFDVRKHSGRRYTRLMLLPLPDDIETSNPHWTVLGQLAAAAAHEIRNPLTTVHGFLQMLQSETPPGIGQEHLAIVLREIDRVTELVSDFLTVAKPQSMERTAVDVGDVAIEVLQASSQLFAERRQASTLSKNGPAPVILGSPLQVHQLLLNLVRNASDAAPVGGNINVEVVSTPEARILIRVCDDGPGFAPAVAERAFEPFFTTKETGTGLGLMICRQIVEAHGGRLLIEDSSSGASLLCSLPAYSQDAGD